MKRQISLLALLVVNIGCAQMIEKRFFPKPTEGEIAQEVSRLGQTEVKTQNALPAAPGSLWPADDRVFFYADKKALRVGDIITVRIIESAQASNTADTDLSRTSSANASFSTFFGRKISQPLQTRR
jgi:flagellar basal body L-ring protein FlgH